MSLRSDRRGDTLLEVVFALAILAMLLTAVTSGAVAAWRTSRLAGDRTVATAVVEEQAEALRAYRSSMDWATFKQVGSGGIGAYITAPGTEPSRQLYMNLRQLLARWEVKDCITGDGCPYPLNTKYTVKTTVVSESPELLKFTIRTTWRSPGRSSLNQTDQVVYLGESD